MNEHICYMNIKTDDPNVSACRCGQTITFLGVVSIKEVSIKETFDKVIAKEVKDLMRDTDWRV